MPSDITPDTRTTENHNPINARPGSDFSDSEFMDIVAGDPCHHGNGLSCRECQHEAEAEEATWD